MPSFLKAGSHFVSASGISRNAAGSPFVSATGISRSPTAQAQKGDVLAFEAWLSSNNAQFSSSGNDPGLLKDKDGFAQQEDISEAQAKQIAAAMQSRSNATDATDIDDLLSQLGTPAGKTQSDQEIFNNLALGALKSLPPVGPATSPTPAKTTPATSSTPGAKPAVKPVKKPSSTSKPKTSDPRIVTPAATSRTPTSGPGRGAGGGNVEASTGTPTSAAATQSGRSSADEESEGLTAVETAGVIGVFVLVGSMIWSVLKK